MKTVFGRLPAGSCVLLAGAAWLAGCATPTTVGPEISNLDLTAEEDRQEDFVVRARFEEQERVDAIARRLLTANADLCPETRHMSGFTYLHRESVERDSRDAATRVYGLGDYPTVIAVAEGFPAAAAGLQVGDQIVAYGDMRFDPDGNIDRQFEQWAEDDVASDRLEVLRAGATHVLEFERVPACDYDVLVADGDEINAYADGSSMFITRGMLRFVENDDELALVIAHELAHNSEGHIDAKRGNTMMAGLGGLLVDGLFAAAGADTGGAFSDVAMNIARGAYSEEFEAEADYVGTYFMARAGFNTEGVEAFWRRMAVESPEQVTIASSHPTSAERFLKIAATAQEIGAKSASGVALTPNREEE